MSGVDKRVFPRFAVQMQVELETKGGQVHRGMSRNLSHGGLCLEVPEALLTGSDVLVRVTLVFDDDRSSEPLELPSRVVWCTPFGTTNQIGTQFRPLSADRLSYLDMFLRFLEQHAPVPGDGENGDKDDPFSG